jgi:hypothetical protein
MKPILSISPDYLHSIHVASYWTKPLPKDLLRKKLHQAVAVATARALIGERKSSGENPT